MASPQLEDGHTRIANELMEAFARTFPGGATAQVLLAIIRRTYGWHKKEDKVSISQLVKMTGRCRRAVIYALQNLETQKFITVQRKRGRGNINQVNTVALQKNYELWVVQRNSPQWEKQLQNKREKYHKEVVQRNGGSAEKSDSEAKGVVQRNDNNGEFSAPTKETIQKINIQKKEYGEFQNVLLTDEELQKLKDKFAGQVEAMIEKLSSYMESKGKHYRSHYATILSWQRRDDGKNRNPRDLPKSYADSPDYPDLA